jgi:transposase-like protein
MTFLRTFQPVSLSVALTLAAVTMAPRDLAQEAEIAREYRKAGANADSVAEKFGVSKRTVYRILTRTSGPTDKPPESKGKPKNGHPRPPEASHARAVNKVQLAPTEGEKREAAIQRITQAMADGEWNSSSTIVEDLAAEFGMSTHTIRHWAQIASVRLGRLVDPHEVTARWLESIDFLATEAYRAKDENKTKLAILAMGRLGALCGAMIRGGAEHAAGKRQASESEQKARETLIEMGWKPPVTLAELPMPNVDDPTGLAGDEEQSHGESGQG